MTFYYPSTRGIEFLNTVTKFKWCTVHPSQLNSNMCVATVVPPWAHNENYCALNSFSYAPESKRFIHQPSTFNKSLVKSGKIIKFLPAVRYDLKGMTVNLPTYIQYLGNNIIQIEGSVALRWQFSLKTDKRN
ncbi:MAG: hypothetical protein JSR33_08550 [Proteobacteria bacterium]|nr:hypothetical protein [Pseudomonadota bacterium]